MTFQDLINQLSSAVNENPTLPVEQVIDMKLAEMGISETTRTRVKEACGLIDSYSKDYDNLQTAKAHGKSRRAWLEHRLDKSTERFSEDERNVILAAIAKQLHKVKSWISKN